MAIPSWSNCRVYGTWTDVEGNRLPGTVTAAISARVTNKADDLIIPAGRYDRGCVDLNTTDPTRPALDFPAPATDDPDIPETGWALQVVVTFSNRSIKSETYILKDLPSDGAVDLRTIIPSSAGAINFGAAGFKVGIPGGVPLLDSEMRLVDAAGNIITTDGTTIDLDGIKDEVSTIKGDTANLSERVDALPVMEPDMTDFASQLIINPPAGAAIDPATKAKIDAMPALVVVSDPSLIPAGTVGLVIT